MSGTSETFEVVEGAGAGFLDVPVERAAAVASLVGVVAVSGGDAGLERAGERPDGGQVPQAGGRDREHQEYGEEGDEGARDAGL